MPFDDSLLTDPCGHTLWHRRTAAVRFERELGWLTGTRSGTAAPLTDTALSTDTAPPTGTAPVVAPRGGSQRLEPAVVR